VRNFPADELSDTPEAVLLAVADGVSRCPDGGAVSEWIVGQKLREARLRRSTGTLSLEPIRAALRTLHEEFLHEFREEPNLLESGCTLALAYLQGNRAAILWSGDSPVYHLQERADGFRSQLLTVADKDPFTGALTDCFSGVTPFAVHERMIELEPRDLVVVATDGIRHSGADLASSLDNEGFTAAWLEKVCQSSFDMPNSDDLAIAAVQWAG